MANSNMRVLKVGRTAEQKRVIKYFTPTGCINTSGLTNKGYDKIVQNRLQSLNAKENALARLGIDESQVIEIPPIYFDGYVFNSDVLCKFTGEESVTSAYQFTWLFFGNTQIYAYQYTFHTDSLLTEEKTFEVFYKDVSMSMKGVNGEEKLTTKGCVTEYKPIKFDSFELYVQGDSFRCTCRRTEYTDRAIAAMLMKIREKKEEHAVIR